MTKSRIKEIKNGMKRKKRVLRPEDFLNTGSTLLNLAISGKTNGGWFKGGYFYFVGDSISGKTFICLTGLAEACKREDFDQYEILYDGTTENGALMNIRQFFGKRLAKRLKMRNSSTIEELYFYLDDRLNEDRPFIIVVDSMDGLDSEQDSDTFEERKKAYRKGKEMKGSYGDGKAKINSQSLRKMLKRIWKSGSILIVVGQTRDNMASGGWGDKKTRSGGRALRFYAQVEVWSSTRGHILKKVGKKKRELGITSQVQVKKNRVKGRDRTVHIPIYHSFGIDDIGGNIDFLIEEGHWSGSKNKVNAKEFNFKGLKSKLIKRIEAENEERELRGIVRSVWDRIESACSIKRKRRYE